jgi:hypothetical protein
MVGVLVEKDRRKQQDEDKELRAVRSLLRVREEAAYGIGSGIQTTPGGGAANIDRIGLTADHRYTLTFVHNPEYARSSGGIGIVWVSIPIGDEAEGHHEETAARMRKYRRGQEEEDEDPSRN